MKKAEILKVINKEIANRISEGWAINFGDSSYGYEFRTDMVKDGETPIRICAKSGYGRVGGYHIDTLTAYICKLDGHKWESEEDEPVVIGKYYKVSYNDSWYTVDEQVAIAAEDIRCTRYARRRLDHSAVEISPTEKLLNLMRQRHVYRDSDFRSATLGKLKVTRTDNRYRVALLNRIGNVKAEKTFRLNGGTRK